MSPSGISPRSKHCNSITQQHYRAGCSTSGMEKQEEGASPKQHHNMKGIRLRKWGRWVAEIRMPKTRQKIWLGSYDTKEQAALAYDAALYCLRGLNAKYNFPELIPSIPAANTLSRHDIQAVATKYALGELPSIPRASLPEYNCSFPCGDLPSSSASQSPSCSSENLGAPTLPSSSQRDEGNPEKQAIEDDAKKAEEELGIWESLFRNDDCSSSSATGTDATALAKLPSLDPFQCDMEFENYLFHLNDPAPQNSATLDDVDLWNFGNIF